MKAKAEKRARAYATSMIHKQRKIHLSKPTVKKISYEERLRAKIKEKKNG